MPHVSSKKLNEKFLEKLFDKMIVVFERAQNKKYMSEVTKELFTETEKIMIAKRLAIILMLSGNTPQHRIAQVLKVSPTTVNKMSLQVEIGQYKTILKITKKEKVDLEKILWQIMTVGGLMPPRIGKRYWVTQNI
jgi:uncharacterized protein YerC